MIVERGPCIGCKCGGSRVRWVHHAKDTSARRPIFMCTVCDYLFFTDIDIRDYLVRKMRELCAT